MSVGTGIELDLYLSIQEAFEEVEQCEHSQHETNPKSHEGDAQWYVQVQCPVCDELGPLQAVCNKWMLRISSGILIYCVGGCDMESPDWKLVVKERIK